MNNFIEEELDWCCCSPAVICLSCVCCDMRRFVGGLFIDEGPRAHWESFWSEEGPRIVWEFFLAWRRASKCVGVLCGVKKGLELWGSSSWSEEGPRVVREFFLACWGPRTAPSFVWCEDPSLWNVRTWCVNPVTYSLSSWRLKGVLHLFNVNVIAVP